MSLRTSSVGGNLVYKRFIESTIPSFINGGIYQGERPDNSTKEDIVIRALTITSASNQKQYIDVLAFVPDIEQGSQHTVPDLLRLESVAIEIKNLFESVYEPAYTIYILEMQDQNKWPDGKSHYAFFRLYFQIHEPIEL